MRVSVRTDAGRYYADLEAKATSLKRGVKAALDEIEEVALERADWWSSGPFTQRQLTKLDHPYARRNTWDAYGSSLKTRKTWKRVRYAKRVGQGFPGRINIQTGSFNSAWETHRTRSADSLGFTLYNDSEHAKYLTAVGTRYMIGRPVLNRIMRDVRKKTKGLFRTKLRRAMATRGAGAATSAMASTAGLDLRGAFLRGFRMGATLTP